MGRQAGYAAKRDPSKCELTPKKRSRYQADTGYEKSRDNPCGHPQGIGHYLTAFIILPAHFKQRNTLPG
ncbi:hypothetical protein J2W55_002122 [Mucilaginibacter pocheonensis]|uniref:Uncharacterized protein n=1 Tax=Mucilaginibacter pocheonensis TaxID=398050 RepID=A0ABU1TA54_9SPHI|nr:hypothetical protein [Mucilaginibacter pocheonensis]